MILFVDETECEDYFIVAGLLTDSKLKTDATFKKFKKKVKNFHISPKDKEKIFTEFKSVSSIFSLFKRVINPDKIAPFAS